ncbi:MAG: quercetin dioxygenase-like cupin family protein [Candidatus Poriferisodalaceae bacterium]|jgi:quercetin dioxygenase-like cupin family protein
MPAAHVDVTGMIEFADKRRVRKKLIGEDLLEAELVCYEPGQGTQEHFHKTQEEIYYIVEGSGSITIGDEVMQVSAGDMVFSPADVPHSIATADERMVMFFVKGPGTHNRG